VNTIEDIADQLSLQWDTVDQMIDKGLKELRHKIGERFLGPTTAGISAS
jgi:DNA-directed RNA polymerase specialized sigma24 family protein